MKKILLTALICGAGIMSASAKEYVIFQEGELTADQELISNPEFYNWNDAVPFKIENSVVTWTMPTGHQDWWGGGWKAKTTDDFDVTVLNQTNCKVVFEYKTSSTADLKLKMANVVNDVTKAAVETAPITTFVRDGEWHSAEFDIRTTFPGVLESFQKGDTPDLFAPVGGNNWTEGETASFRNVKIVEGTPYVAPIYEHGAKWYGTIEGIDSKSTYNVTVDYVFTALEDGHLQIDAEVDGVDGIPGLVMKMHMADGKGGDPYPIGTKNDDGTWTWISHDLENRGENGRMSDGIFDLGQAVNTLQLWFEYAGGRIDGNITGYVFGAANEKPVKNIRPKMTAEAQNITKDAAEIVYNVTLPEELTGAEVKVYMDDAAEAVSASPVALTDLTPSTKYTHTLKAIATKDGENYESKPVTVEFTTLRDASKARVWHTIVDGTFNNSYLIGEEASSRRNIPVSIETSVSHNVDGTITVEAVPHGAEKIVGLVMKVSISTNDFVNDGMVMAQADGKWTVTTEKVCPDDKEFNDWFAFRPAYDGGETTIVIRGYKAGAENEAPAYGEPNEIELSLSKKELLYGETATVLAVTKDANGHYLTTLTPRITVSGESVVLNGSTLSTVEGQAGGSTITAYVPENPELGVNDQVIVLTSSSAQKLHAGDNVTKTSATAADEEIAKAFDENEGTFLTWDCTTTEEHELKIDLGQDYYVQVVQLVWEGASASEYTLTLTPDTQVAGIRPMDAETPTEGAYFEVKDGQGGAGVTTYKNFYNPDQATMKARYVTLNTQKAFAKDWGGIKLKEVKVMGGNEKAITTGVENVYNEADAEFDVFNLQGVRVLRGVKSTNGLNLPAGIYIANGRKFIVK